MVSNFCYKKVRSISEGNFHGCYASNKAEKFKFRRLSQGLESCAQVQALKLRKEEKQIHKLLDNLENEKAIHKNIRDINEYYLQNWNIDRQDSENVQQPSSDKQGKHQEDEQEEEGSLPQLSPLPNPSHQFKSRETKKRRHTIYGGQPPTRDFHKVTPFYLQHGYTHYHHDDYYDGLLHHEKLAPTFQLANSNQPSWTKPTSLSFLRERRNTIATTSTSEFFGDVQPSNNLADMISSSKIGKTEKIGTKLEGLISERNGTVSALSVKTTTSSLNPENATSCSTLVQVGSSVRTLPGIHVSNLKQRSVLTPFERQELHQHSGHHVKPTSVTFLLKTETEKSLTHAKLAGRHLTMSAIGRMSFLRKMVRKRVKDGSSIEDLLDDPMFDNILDVCEPESIYPAYNPRSSLSLQDFRSLRHCKYLRISELNIRSLKQTLFNKLLSQ